MERDTLTSLLVVMSISVLAPILARLLRRLVIPAAVLEICLGIIAGPHVLGLAAPTADITTLGELGLAFLMFLAGYEIDFAKTRGKPLEMASLRWGASLVLGFASAFVLVQEGLAVSTLVVGLAITSTALGTLFPILRDKGLLDSRIGTHIVAAGTVGEFGPIVAIVVLLSGDNPLRSSLFLLGFLAIAIGAIWIAFRPRPPRFDEIMYDELHSSSQLPVRFSVLVIAALLWLASDFGLDILLGAFSAGIIVRIVASGDYSDAVSAKLDAIGHGFLIPLFFVVSGLRFDLDILIDDWWTAARVPLFFMLFWVVRGFPTLIGRDGLTFRERLAVSFFAASQLPIVVAVTSVGLATGRIDADETAALVGAAVLSVVVYPIIGFRLVGSSKAAGAGVESAADKEVGAASV
jgi:Kef-type K+ transport system membrane component KefB